MCGYNFRLFTFKKIDLMGALFHSTFVSSFKENQLRNYKTKKA